MWIAVFKLRCIVEKPSVLQILKNRHICILAESTCPVSLLRHLTLFIHQLNKGEVIAASYLGVIFTKSRRNMNHTCTICEGYIICTSHIVSFFSWIYKAEQRFILFVFQVCSFIVFQDLHVFSQNFFQKGLSHIIDFSFIIFLYFHIIFFWIHTECHVRRQCPRCGRPCQEISILSHNFKTNDC